ncbi:hypothetical protein BBH99_15335 [Chryseobacterium contaminans]|uniref:Uncharacterized protein n=1 Tax=Chryseobacterium contaminans TaxID=1423959 RepID=A0ABX2XB93_9FLAO|nr:hypothetical protein BBH99_15335 [Chryseobacterium contaminans]
MRKENLFSANVKKEKRSLLFIHRECFSMKGINMLFYYSLLLQLSNKLKLKLISVMHRILIE